jgi:hypothetical protein
VVDGLRFVEVLGVTATPAGLDVLDALRHARADDERSAREGQADLRVAVLGARTVQRLAEEAEVSESTARTWGEAWTLHGIVTRGTIAGRVYYRAVTTQDRADERRRDERSARREAAIERARQAGYQATRGVAGAVELTVRDLERLLNRASARPGVGWLADDEEQQT